MRKKLAACICVALLVCAIGAAQVLAAGPALRGKTPGERPEGMPDKANGFHRELTDEQKTQMEDARKQQEEKLDAFISSLSSEQKTLFEAMMPAKPTEGQMPDKNTDGWQPAKPDGAAMEDMKQKREAFIASLSESQKTAYEELFGKRQNMELTDEQKAKMDNFRKQREEKLEAFINSLSSEQKALYDAMMPAKPKEGQQRAKPDNAAMEDMKQKQEAFVASLSESQKTAYEELFGKPFHQFGKFNDNSNADMQAKWAQFGANGADHAMRPMGRGNPTAQ